MVIKEAYESPIVLTETALFEKLNVKNDKIKKLSKSILSGEIRLKNADEEENVKKFLDKNHNNIKTIYDAVSKDTDKINPKKDFIKLITGVGVSLAAAAGSLLGPSAILIGTFLFPVEITLLLITVLSWLYVVIKGFKTSADGAKFDRAKDSLIKIRRELQRADPDNFKDDKLRKEYNDLMDELDIVIENARQAESA